MKQTGPWAELNRVGRIVNSKPAQEPHPPQLHTYPQMLRFVNHSAGRRGWIGGRSSMAGQA